MIWLDAFNRIQQHVMQDLSMIGLSLRTNDCVASYLFIRSFIQRIRSLLFLRACGKPFSSQPAIDSFRVTKSKTVVQLIIIDTLSVPWLARLGALWLAVFPGQR